MDGVNATRRVGICACGALEPEEMSRVRAEAYLLCQYVTPVPVLPARVRRVRRGGNLVQQRHLRGKSEGRNVSELLGSQTEGKARRIGRYRASRGRC